MPGIPKEQATVILTGVQDRLDAASRQGPDRYRDALAEASPGVCVHELSDEAKIVRVNAEETKVLGYREDQLVGHHPWEFIVMNEVSQRAIAQKLTGAKELKPFVRTFRHANGRAMTMLLVDRHIVDDHGKIVGLRTAFTEISLD